MKMPVEAIKGLHQLDQWIAGVQNGDMKSIIESAACIVIWAEEVYK